MALENDIERIKNYCSEAEYRIKEIKNEIEDFDGYNSLEIIEVKIVRAIDNLESARKNVMQAYDEIEE